MAQVKRFIVHRGEYISLHALAVRHGLPPRNVRERYDRGFRDDALVAPLKKKSPHGQAKPAKVSASAARKRTIYSMLGKYTVAQIAEAVGLTENAVSFHVRSLREVQGDKLVRLPALAVVKLLQGESPWSLDDFLREDLLLRLREAGFPVDLGPRIKWE